MTGHRCTGHPTSRWGTHFDPSTLLELWQKHVAFLHLCNSHPQELVVFCYSVTLLWSVSSTTTDFATEAQIWAQGKYGKYKRSGQKLPERSSCGGSSGQHPHHQTGDGRGQGTVPGAALLQGSSCPADMTGEKCNSWSRRENQLGNEALVLCQWERQRKKRWKRRGRLPEKYPQNRKMNGITSKEWVFRVISKPTFMVSGIRNAGNNWLKACFRP